MLALSHVSKSFPGVQALSRVSLAVAAGEIHALVGENGAGKSTLTKIIAGVYQPDEGQIEFDGEIVHWASPGAAQAARHPCDLPGTGAVPATSRVAENIFLGHERSTGLGMVDHRRTRRGRARGAAANSAWRSTRGERVGDLTVADQQMVEIAKALVQQRQAADPRRADRGDLRPRGGAAVRAAARAATRRRRHHLHLAPAR